MVSMPANAGWKPIPNSPSNYPVLSWQFGPLGAPFFWELLFVTVRNQHAATAMGPDGHSTQRQHHTGKEVARRLSDLDVIDV